MPDLETWSNNPLIVIGSIYEEGKCNWEERVNQYFQTKLNDEQHLNSLPWLNYVPLHELSPNRIVRFRGMIQDMFDNEFYFDQYEVLNKTTNAKKMKLGRYRDIAECDLLTSVDVKTCLIIWRKMKRLLLILQIHKLAIDLHITAFLFLEKMIGLKSDEESDAKRVRTSSHIPPTSKAGNSIQSYNFPLPNMKGIACILKVYNDTEFLLNELVDVIGILTMDPVEQNIASSLEMEFGNISDVLPSSLVPRLHVLMSKKLLHINPLLSNNEYSIYMDIMRESREMLRLLLQDALLGDSLASDFLLCHLISGVYARQGAMVLGSFCLNLSGINKELQDQNYVYLLYCFLQSLLTHSHYYPMKIDDMNKTPFIPKKDYQQNFLKSALLQLPSSTNLVIDETTLMPGQLNEQGIRNLSALSGLVKWQKLDYDFQFHSLEQLVDIPVLLISEGRSMVNSDCELKLSSACSNVSEVFQGISEKLSPALLNQFRIYLTQAKLLEYSLPNDMQKFIEEDFVSNRSGENKMTADDLHDMLSFARLLSKSCGEKELSHSVWNSTKILIHERKQRLL